MADLVSMPGMTGEVLRAIGREAKRASDYPLTCHKLSERGMVRWTGSRWELTPAGREWLAKDEATNG